MPETVGFPVDFTAFTPDQNERVTRLCFGYATQVLEEVRLLNGQAAPVVDGIASQLDNAPPELSAALGQLVVLLEQFYSRLAEGYNEFGKLLLSETSKGETAQ